MNYQIVFESEAQKKLKYISYIEKNVVMKSVNRLIANPDDENLSIKKLIGAANYYRLETGNWRLILKRHDDTKTINIYYMERIKK